MAEPLAPHDIARRNFEVARRGYEQQDVRAFLHEVSSLVERLQRSETQLRERAERAEARLTATEHPDEAVMLEILGEETTRVLTSAREAAVEIRAKAEASAERLIADATEEAGRARASAAADAEQQLAAAKAESESILDTARTELERRSAEAEAAAAGIRDAGAAEADALREEGQRDLAGAREEAEQVLETARTEGRHMVGEAQAVRERVLRDLAVRRKKARLQVEKLNAGRERLLQAYDVVRRTIDEATEELTVSLSDARLAADAAARRLEEEPEPTLEQLDEEVANAGLVDLPIALVEEPDVHDDAPGPFSGEVPAVQVPDAEAAPATDVAEALPAETTERRARKSRRRKGGFEGLPPAELTKVEPPGEDEGVRIVAEPTVVPEAEPAGEPAVEDAGVGADAEAGAAAGPAAEEVAAPEAAPGKGKGADDVFARLRAGSAGDGDTAVAGEPEAEGAPSDAAEAEPDEEEPEPNDEAKPFLARDEALSPVDKELSRRLKRALADEQNEVLDLLRRAKPKGVDDLLPAADEHAGRWADTVASVLADAAAAGAGTGGGTATSVADLADELARGLVGPLRERIDRSFAASDGNLDDVADRVRALYREWKGQRLTETSQHFVVAAYARGAFDAVASGAEVRWVVDPSTAPCPDCDDNVLAGAVAKGEDFPTGSPCAPAHPGCRCLVLPA